MRYEVQDPEGRRLKLRGEERVIRHVHDVQEHRVANTAKDDEDRDQREVAEQEHIEDGARGCCNQRDDD